MINWEEFKIAGNTEHNRQIDEMRKSCEEKERANNFINQLQNVNKHMQAQLDMQSTQLKAEEKELKRTKIRGWIQFAISSLIALAGVGIALAALFVSLGG